MTSLIDELPTSGVGMVIEDYPSQHPMQQQQQQPMPMQMNQEMQQQQQQPVPSNGPGSVQTLNQDMISQIVNGIQQASMMGATALPSRDIPMDTNALTQDHTAMPNYVPQPSVRNYIQHEQEEMTMNRYLNQEAKQTAWDALYDDIRTPLLLAVLYFFFQLPIFKQTLYRYTPFLCSLDGNLNLKGLVFSCGLFGSLFYVTRHIGLSN